VGMILHLEFFYLSVFGVWILVQTVYLVVLLRL
jgi:hypothetical protein